MVQDAGERLVMKMMLTAHRVLMSPRMERVQRYLRHHCKISISDWSTDMTVWSVLPQLQAAADYVTAMIAGTAPQPPGEAYTVLEMEAMAADIAAIMRRVPANRAA